MDGRSERSKNSNWYLEALSLLAALALAAGLVAVLLKFDGRDIQTWQYPVTINALASIITLVFRACLLFVACECISQWKWILFHRRPHLLIDFERIDWASRGPLGSSWLLLSTLTRTHITGLGATIMLLTLALDPFTQQIIQLREIVRFETESSQNQIHFSDRYDAGEHYRENETRHDNGSVIAQWNAVTSVDMQSAILFGLSHTVDEVRQQTPWTCPTADCRWPEYTSLAVCSECADTTDQISRVEGNSINIYDGYATRSIRGLGDAATAFSLPNGQFIVNLDGNISYDNRSGLGTGGQGVYIMTASGTGNPNNTLALQHRSALIWATNILSLQPSPENRGQWPGAPLASQECGLYWCRKTYRSEVSNNTLREEEEEISTLLDMQKYAIFDWPRWSLDFAETLETTTTGPGLAELCPEDGAGVCGEVYGDAVLSTNHYFHKNFVADVTPDNATAGLGPGRLHNEADWFMYRPLPDTFGALWSWDRQHLGSKFEAMAKSMSNIVRSTGSARIESDFIEAEVGRTATHYRIEWRWIALHGVVAAFSAVFFALTVWQSRRHGTPLFKSSALAVLKRGPYVTDVLDGAETQKEVEKRAKNCSAVLSDGPLATEAVRVGLLADPKAPTTESEDGGTRRAI